jgi:hypothetical protein
MRLEYQLEANWPVQAWLAECFADRVVVRHGGRVEAREHWFCEAVWDGPFAGGDFDLTDIVAGSGARLRGGRVRFVTAGNTVDRLQSISLPAGGGSPARTLVSNSLAGLLAASGATINPRYRHYRRDMQSVVKGIYKYRKTLDTSLGPCRLWYFNNFDWDGRTLHEVEKPDPERDFSAFEPYHRFLDETMGRVAANALDPARRHAIGLMGTMSNGYDSTTVGTLASRHGLEEILTLDEGRTHEDDSGTVAARTLGLKVTVIPREGWRKYPFAEVPFLTADGYAEDRFFISAQDHLRNKLMFTGFHGDKVWGKRPYGRDSLVPHPEVKRGDCSGLTMTEFRLSTGFINCAVPFWGARHIHEVVAISRHPSMKPWDVPGDYSRPICRRIAETAGIPREAFGRKKMAGSIMETVLNGTSGPDYRAWCERNGIEGDLFDRAVRRAISSLPGSVRGKVRHMFYHERVPTCRDYFFPWALERRAEVYLPAAASVRRLAARPDPAFASAAPGLRREGERVAVAV